MFHNSRNKTISFEIIRYAFRFRIHCKFFIVLPCRCNVFCFFWKAKYSCPKNLAHLRRFARSASSAQFVQAWKNILISIIFLWKHVLPNALVDNRDCGDENYSRQSNTPTILPHCQIWIFFQTVTIRINNV